MILELSIYLCIYLWVIFLLKKRTFAGSNQNLKCWAQEQDEWLALLLIHFWDNLFQDSSVWTCAVCTSLSLSPQQACMEYNTLPEKWNTRTMDATQTTENPISLTLLPIFGETVLLVTPQKLQSSFILYFSSAYYTETIQSDILFHISIILFPLLVSPKWFHRQKNLISLLWTITVMKIIQSYIKF